MYSVASKRDCIGTAHKKTKVPPEEGYFDKTSGKKSKNNFVDLYTCYKCKINTLLHSYSINTDTLVVKALLRVINGLCLHGILVSMVLSSAQTGKKNMHGWRFNLVYSNLLRLGNRHEMCWHCEYLLWGPYMFWDTKKLQKNLEQRFFIYFGYICIQFFFLNLISCQLHLLCVNWGIDQTTNHKRLDTYIAHERTLLGCF